MSGNRKRMLDQDEIDRGVQEVSELCVAMVDDGATGTVVLLIGGAALQHYGSERLTSDIDVVSNVPIVGLDPEKQLSFGGYASHTPSGVPVDVVLRNDDYAELYEEAAMYGRRIEGVPIPVVSPEYAVCMKMAARRPKDTADIDALLQAEMVDVPKARRLVKRLLGRYAVDDFDSMVREAAWRKEHG